MLGNWAPTNNSFGVFYRGYQRIIMYSNYVYKSANLVTGNMHIIILIVNKQIHY